MNTMHIRESSKHRMKLWHALFWLAVVIGLIVFGIIALAS